ncbi:MAG: murein transglycosylase A, partial [Acidobacteria bacterium]|nr:murein transglycosylase A [Acidobacteriota bacterium]
ASCRRLLRQDAETVLRPEEVGGRVKGWQGVCRRAEDLAGRGADEVRAFFERELDLFAVSNHGRREGLFTGYYEPTLRGSRRRHAPYLYPLHRRPRDMPHVDLGKFRQDLAGRRIAGRLRGNRLDPYPDRGAIDAGALGGQGLELLWVDDPVDAFFLHVQGSGRVELEEGGFLRVGYDGQNGHPYVAIGRELVQRGAMELSQVSMQSIRAWLLDHPVEGRQVMAANPSYVFFRRLSEPGPVGSQGVVLTPGRSLAVDRKFLPLGAPLWLDATMPALPAEGADPAAAGDEPLQRLLIAQDTGGAIRGPVRGDVFWGPGDAAAERAGRMKHPGRLWILLPKGLR